jgi:hypothetical protein
MNDYAAFLDRKAQLGTFDGFEPLWLPSFLFDFQASLVDWALRKGKAAIFADCGLGKTPMQLVWAENVVRKTGGRVLILTPLAVAAQTVREGEKFGIEVGRSLPHGAGIVVSNYERLGHYDPADFVAAVADESSILKSFDGVRREEVTEFMRRLPYRLLCTATAAPNDYVELGTSSEALGELGHMDMLNRFFKNQNNTSDTKGRWRGHAAPRAWEGKQWRFKGHAEVPFWRWVCSWARAVRRPSDLGFEDGAFVLPPLDERAHLVSSASLPDGMLFALPAMGLHEQRAERRRTIKERCERMAALAAGPDPALAWCHLNAEGALLRDLIPGAIEVSGAMPDEAKEEAFAAFTSGQTRVLITKPKIGAWGLNFQHCAHVLTFPSHSYEQLYQGVRRCWRFGQTRPVVVDTILTEGDGEVLKSVRRKAAAADRMFTRLVAQMGDALRIERGAVYPHREEVPTWLS